MTILVDFYVSVLFLEPETHKQTNKNKIESWSLVLLLSVRVFLSGFDLIGLVVSGKKKKDSVCTTGTTTVEKRSDQNSRID